MQTYLGQFAIVTVLVLLLAAHLLRAPHLWLIGFLVVVALIKPQLAILGVAGVGPAYLLWPVYFGYLF